MKVATRRGFIKTAPVAGLAVATPAAAFQGPISETTGATDHRLITAGGVNPYCQPTQEVNILALKSEADADDISLTLRRAAAAFPGQILRLPPGNYTAETVFEVGDLDAALIRADGANITVAADITFFRAGAPTFEAIQTISAVDGEDYWGGRQTITCSDGAAYAVGDLVRCVSDDKQRCTRPAVGSTDYRRGFYAFVVSISGNILTLDRPIPWDLTTNPRIGRLPRRRYQWKGGVIGYESGHEADRHGSVCIMYGVSDLEIEVEIDHTYTSAINVVGCMDARIRAVGRDLRNDEGNSQYGYIINDGNSQGTRADVVGGRNRHGYTTNQSLIEADIDDLHLYGATFGALVTGQVHGDTQAGFDTHHGSEHCTFMGCVVSGGTTGGGQFVIRGIGHRLVSPQAYNGKEGILIFTEDGVTEPSSVNIEGAHVDVDRYAIYSWGKVDVEIRGGSFRSRKFGRVVSGIAGALKLRGAIDIRPGPPSESDYSRAFNLNDCAVDARGSKVVFDLQDVDVATINYGAIQGDGDTACSWIGGEVRTINDDALSTVFYKAAASTATFSFAPDEIVTEKLGVDPTTSMITGAGGVGFSGPVKWRTEDGAGRSAYMTRQLTADDEQINLLWRGDPMIVCVLSATGAARVMGAMPDGIIVGQEILLRVPAASWNVTVKHGTATYNADLGGADVVLSAGDSLRLIWDGSDWLRV